MSDALHEYLAQRAQRATARQCYEREQQMAMSAQEAMLREMAKMDAHSAFASAPEKFPHRLAAALAFLFAIFVAANLIAYLRGF
jgi:hypothetical protein